MRQNSAPGRRTAGTIQMAISILNSSQNQILFCPASARWSHTPGRAVTQRELEEELLNKYFPDRGQLNLFEKELSLQEYIDAAYKKQNALIGFRI